MEENQHLLRLTARLRLVRWVLFALSLLTPIGVGFGDIYLWDWQNLPIALRVVIGLSPYGALFAFLGCDLVVRILQNRLKGRTLEQHFFWCGIYLLCYMLYAFLWFIYYLIGIFLLMPSA